MSARVSGETNASAMMIAESATDVILRDSA